MDTLGELSSLDCRQGLLCRRVTWDAAILVPFYGGARLMSRVASTSSIRAPSGMFVSPAIESY